MRRRSTGNECALHSQNRAVKWKLLGTLLCLVLFRQGQDSNLLHLRFFRHTLLRCNKVAIPSQVQCDASLNNSENTNSTGNVLYV
jgi:hypothetical protein